MTHKWLTWTCFLSGLKLLAIIGTIFALLIGLAWFFVWLSESGRGKLAVAIGIGMAVFGTIFMGMLICAGY